MNASGTDLEPVLRKDSLSAVLFAATAAGIMFFPNYIAWGQDQAAAAYLLRMNRNQLGAANPAVAKIMHVQSCAWYTWRTRSDGT
ncbi:hypothetical protein [Arthrobacter sp. FW306-07-I]|uniref:hypothetical protein n=1 Tax=Arthrobacter sp. FW306-07-I TaxID=2879622 RepID=UPI001F22A954|nr:hypothetical protein [Arthrobacter sp. FW306-07-I]UKA74578.1 hypothetical protein LFT46_15635 [Arthrobacter sp. FW306-07-I]